MNKEMFISSSPHETKVAVCEDGQLVEVYFERDTDVGLVGGIYKGRVNRVLPGMQSAFVDIGLERDAFLYVSDFSLQDQDEFEGVLDESQTRGATIEVEPQKPVAETGTAARREMPEAARQTVRGGEVEEPAEGRESPEVTAAAQPSSADSAVPRQSGPGTESSGEGRDFHRRSHRGRRRRGRRGRGGFGDRRQERRAEPPAEAPKPEPAAETEDFEILPGESLAKYRHPSTEDPARTEGAARPAIEESFSEPDAFAHDAGPDEDPQVEDVPTQVKNEIYAESKEEQPQAESNTFAVPATEHFSATTAPVEKSITEKSEHRADVASDIEEASEFLAEPGFETEEGESEDEEPVPVETDDELHPEASLAPEEESETEESNEAEERAGKISEGTGESSERSFTLREPHARPHFAPRRGRRGRRRTGRHSRRNASRERETSRPSGQQGLLISELLKEGQEIIVQIAKEPLGTKGARITSHVALPGRYVVFMPTITHIGVSRKIASEQERLRLRNIVMEHKGALTGGFIVRTAGEGRSDEEIKADLRFLTNLWNDIRTRAEQVKAPALLYRDLDLAQRLMRDLVTPDFKSIWLDNEADYERVVEFVNRLQPSLVGSAKLHTRLTSLFEEHGIEDEIAKALKPKVWLKSGGYIVINQTEALVAIDVNTGKYVGKTNRLEDTIVRTNIDAVNEIVRQIRLRDLGGIIVIDFIDMDERRNRNKVVQALEEALRRDRAPTKVLSFNDFGLVAVTRKRVKQSLERTLCDPCAYCNGSGWVKSVSSVIYEIMAEARKMADEIEGKTITLRVSPEVAQELKSKDGAFVREIEALTHKNLVIKSDPAIHQERFEIF
ncbi:MAG TPA: Rne/Rng family ribonuclease [Terriglobia bacterium]|nr:Rne/Rng family ribonuclease [Terriglobia bacterium]